MLSPENFDKLLPKFHLRGINFLLEKGLFADHDGSLRKASDVAKKLETILAKTSATNAKKDAAKKKGTLETQSKEKSLNFVNLNYI